MHVLRICLPLHALRLSMNKAGSVTASVDAQTMSASIALIQYFVNVRLAALQLATDQQQQQHSTAGSAPSSRGSTPRMALRERPETMKSPRGQSRH